MVQESIGALLELMSPGLTEAVPAEAWRLTVPDVVDLTEMTELLAGQASAD